MTTFRKDTRDGLYGLLTGFQTANSTMLTHTYRRRPGSFPDDISAFVGSLPETIAHTGGSLSQRTITPTVVFTMKMTEPPSQGADAMDLVVDAFVTYANGLPHAISNQTVVLPVACEDIELTADGTDYPSVIVQWNAIALEGRT